jgi:hypothetical protein
MSLTLDSAPRRPVRAPVVSAVNGNHLPKALDAQPVERGIAALPATAEKPGKLVNPPKRHEPVYLAGPLSGQGIYLLRPLQLLGRAIYVLTPGSEDCSSGKPNGFVPWRA